jgi:tetratricopeptide (TPR) repeat protein
MMIAQPVPATQELADEINLYFARGKKPTEFEIKKLEKKAELLKSKIDFSDYYIFLGLIATLTQDISKITYYFEKAKRLEPTSNTVLSNYFVALMNAGKYFEAFELSEELLDNYHNENWLFRKIRLALEIGKYDKAYNLLSKLEEPERCDWYEAARNAIEIARKSQLHGEEAENLHKIALSVISKNNLYFSGIRITIVQNCIHYNIVVDSPIEKIADINWQLADVLVENTENTFSDVLIFEYSSIDTSQKRKSS